MTIRHAVSDVRTMKRLFTEAEAEARRDGQDAFAAEHLLLAALSVEPSARAALARTGHEPDELRAALARQHAAALAAVGVDAGAVLTDDAPAGDAPSGAMTSTATGRSVFQRAREHAGTDKRAITGAHVVLAASELDHGTVPRTLAELGVDRAALADAARAEMHAG
jgi:ATP-dependent Clp protease ATP-binding subunit ClpA